MAAAVEGPLPGGTAINCGSYYQEASDVYMVTGLVGQGYNTISQAMLTSGIPLLWSAHPSTQMLDLRAVSYESEVADPGVVTIRVRYVNVVKRTYRGGSNLALRPSYKDGWGNTISVTYKGKAYYAEAQFLEPDGIFTVCGIYPNIFSAYTINESVRIDPITVMNTWQGSINSTSFVIGGVVFAPQTLLFQTVDYDNDGLGDVAWNMSTEIRYKRNKWDPEVWYLNDDGLPPSDITDVGHKIVQMYPQLNFNACTLF